MYFATPSRYVLQNLLIKAHKVIYFLIFDSWNFDDIEMCRFITDFVPHREMIVSFEMRRLSKGIFMRFGENLVSFTAL